MTQKEALDILKAGYNVYLTGCAGSGKTYLLEQFITSLRFKKIRAGITASTGVAATHLSGMTIHAWAGVGIKNTLTDGDLDELLQRKYLLRRFRDTKVLIIDEVSMLSAHTFEAVDRILRLFKNTDEPFGGLQVVLSGDFFQLPPIGRESAQADFIYKSPLWKELDLKICYLDKPYRQDDKRFLSMLDAIREDNVTKDTWDTLKLCFLNGKGHAAIPTKLYTHNAHADTVNTSELAKLPGVPRVYMTEMRGNPTLGLLLQKNCLAPERLVLKKGALVMFVKNNTEAGYINGTMGTVVEFDDDGFPVVETYDGKQITAYPVSWEIEDDGDAVAKIIQIPLRLAWAITIHKSQGMSLDAAEIDLGKSFVAGMGYVALSRVRTLEGIKLRSVNRTALSVNREILVLDKQLREESEEIAEELRNSYWHKKNINN
jgi:ATP-dependent DNA helicase PIF1